MYGCWLGDQKGLKSLREDMDREEPGWETTEVYCISCRVEHTITSDERQGTLLREMRDQHTPGQPQQSKRLPPIPAGKPDDWCRWHETSSPQLAAPCAYCRASLHCHKDALGRVKSGASGFVIERCPACHLYNAVQPTYGKTPGITTSPMEDGEPVLQLTMGRM